MISVFYTHFYSPLGNERFISLLELMPEAIRCKILGFRKWEDAHACLLGKCLLIHAITCKKKNISVTDLQYTAAGRPYFCSLSDFDFNISHSGNMVVCAVTDRGKTGIDIEERKHLNINHFKDQFSDREWKYIKDEEYPHYTFYDYWTKKEAALKADGRGISLSLHCIDVSSSGKLILDNQAWFLLKIDAFKDYACNLAYNIIQDDISLQSVDFKSRSVLKEWPDSRPGYTTS